MHWLAPRPDTVDGSAADWMTLRTSAHALDGMQKEAVVAYGPSGSAWRMVCDEGPYLNGTDLAPFPLAFFCAGMVSSFMAELLALLRERRIDCGPVRLLQDNRYSMAGSATAGTMTGNALPVELQLETNGAADQQALVETLADAVAAAPASALLRSTLENTFALTLNGTPLTMGRVRNCARPSPPEPLDFNRINPAEIAPDPDLITKLKSGAVVTGVTGGAGSSLTDNQKRILHMRGICSQRADGLLETTVELYQPLGSRFCFLADTSRDLGGMERAPSGVMYMSAGLAFCYLTQIGRYCNIMKKPLESYSIVQDTGFSLPGATGRTGLAAHMAPVVTHVYLHGTGDAAFARSIVDMSEQTCFLHAACRNRTPIRIKTPSIALNRASPC